jgi:hypothetical protein
MSYDLPLMVIIYLTQINIDGFFENKSVGCTETI